MIIIVISIMKAIGIFFGTLHFKLHILRAAPLYSPVQWQWSLTSQYYLSFKYFRFFFTNFCIFIWFLLVFCYWFRFFFLKLIIFIVYSLKGSQNFLIQFLTLYTSSLFSMLLNDDNVDTEKHDEICSSNFVANKSSGLFLHPSVLILIF